MVRYLNNDSATERREMADFKPTSSLSNETKLLWH